MLIFLVLFFLINVISQTCSAGLATNCITCRSSKNRTFNSSTGKCDCDTGTYDNGSLE